jgi:hypothetical protein
MSTHAPSRPWESLPDPEPRDALGFEAEYGAADAPRLRAGVMPQSMDHKWLVWFDGEWLRFIRSWTQTPIYGVRLAPTSSGGLRVVDSWVSRDASCYNGGPVAHERQLLAFLIDGLLLQRPQTVFPANAPGAPPGLEQHVFAGTAWPERPVHPRPRVAAAEREACPRPPAAMACPHCGVRALRTIEKLLLTPLRSRRCAGCGYRISASWMAPIALVPLLAALFVAQSLWPQLPLLAVLALALGAAATAGLHLWSTPLVMRLR